MWSYGDDTDDKYSLKQPVLTWKLFMLDSSKFYFTKIRNNIFIKNLYLVIKNLATNTRTLEFKLDFIYNTHLTKVIHVG